VAIAKQNRTTDKLRILLADDHAVLRDGLRGLINRQPDMEVVGEAADGHAALKLARRLRPDLLLMDVSMPKLDGIAATRELKKSCPQVRVIAYTAHTSAVVLSQMRRAGAVGYVCKDVDPEEILTALRRVARGGVHFDPKLLGEAVGQFLADPGPVTDLSRRETQVLRSLAQGYTAKEVAAEIKVSTKSVETYKARLMLKLGVKSRVEMMAYAQLKYPGDRL
jgi:DNA-binding NarL/FixJ family response regulator